MPALDMPDIIRELANTPGSAIRRHLLGEHAEWGPHQENTARLLEVQAYQFDLEWARLTADPGDREARLERLEAQRSGVKPPRHPIIPPTADRPPGLAEQRMQSYVDQWAEQQPQRVRHSVSRAEFDRAMGLD